MSFSIWPAPGILALYHLEDVNDSSGNSYTLTNNNTVGFAIGKFGNAADFGASNANKYLSINSDCGINPGSDAFTILGWICLNGQPGAGARFAICHIEKNAAGGVCYLEYYNNSGTYLLGARYGSAQDNYPLSATKTLAAGTWHLITITSSAAGAGKLFVDGAVVATGSRGSEAGASVFVNIGRGWPITGWNYFSGKVDEFAYLNYEMTAQQVRRLYAFQRGMIV